MSLLSGCKGSKKSRNDQTFRRFFRRKKKKKPDSAKIHINIWLSQLYLIPLHTITTLIRSMKRRLLLLASALLLLTTTWAQEEILPASTYKQKAFQHLDISLTSGTTGIGFDLSMPLNDVFSLRAGYATMPHFSHTMHFGVQVGEDPATSQSKFERLAGLLEDFTSNKVDNVVDMIGQPTYWNWKLLVDVKPFRNKHWHFTAGVFAGNSQIAKAVNSIEDMPSTMAVNIYNNLYYKALRGEPFVEYGEMSVYHQEIAEKFISYGKMSIRMADYKHDVYYDEDVVAEYDQFIGNKAYEEGDIIYHGSSWVDEDGVEHGPDIKYHKGDAYRMMPDNNSMLRAWAYAKRFKPYLGFGYGGRLLKKDPSWQVSFDCGALFWGGTPRIVTHDGTDLVNDVENVRGKVGDYVDIVKKFKVFPVLNLRITKRIF